MQVKLGEKIRELRRRDGRTQEALAEAVGVTSQAVSRWESGGSYPDVEIMPAIANYFHVSIDELFGYHGDREEKIKATLDRADTMMQYVGLTIAQGSMSEEIGECVEMLRAASEEFPNETRILIKLAKALHMFGWHKYGARGRIEEGSDFISDDVEYNAQNIYWQEALSVYERLLASSPSPDERETAICQMINLSRRMGKYEKAKALANQQNSMNICKELLLPKATAGEEMQKYQGESIMALLSNLQWVISDAVCRSPSLYTSEYGRQVLLAVASLYETVFVDGRCGVWHWNIAILYLTLADYEAKYGEIQKALAYFDSGFDHCKAYNCEEYSYSAPLVSKVKHVAREKCSPVSADFWKSRISNMPTELRDELRKNGKYAECFE